jgi:predicted dehydrogenase
MIHGLSRRSLLQTTCATLATSTLADILSACAQPSGMAAAAGPAAASGSERAGGATTVEPLDTGPPALPPEQRVRFALVGLGKLTLEELLPAFAECKFARATALVSGDRKKAEAVGRQYGIETAHLYDYQTFDRLRDDAQVDVVYIVLPNNMHAEYTIRAAQAGKHVLCEKPMANSVEECRQMIEACEKAQRKLMIAYRMQYEPFNREVIRAARAGELGTLKNMITSNSQIQPDPASWRLKRALAGGGPLPDIGIYCLNAARYISGEEPVEVSAIMHSTPGDPRWAEVEEQINFTLRFPSGLLASCASSYDAHESKNYRVLGSKGWVELDPGFSYRGLRMRMALGEKGAQQLVEKKIEQKNQFALELDHMAQCVRENRKPHTPGEEGMQDMRLIAAIYQAARTGQSVKLAPVKGTDVFRGPKPG